MCVRYFFTVVFSHLNAQEETAKTVIRFEEDNPYRSADKALNTALKITICLAIFGGLFWVIGGCFGIFFAKRVSFSIQDYRGYKRLQKREGFSMRLRKA